MIYVKKIINQDVQKEIAFPKEPSASFFDFDCMNPDQPYQYIDFIFRSENKSYAEFNETVIKNVRMRQHWQRSESKLTSGLADFVKEKLKAGEDDFIVFTSLKASQNDKKTGKVRYAFDVIKKEQTELYEKYAFFMKDNHVIFNNDDNKEESNMPETKPFEKYEYKVFENNPETRFNRIVFGAPGTGKSYTLNRDKDGDENNKISQFPDLGGFERVTFHPNYSYAQFVGTYKPVSDKKDIEYKYVPGPFMRLLTAALENAKDINKGQRKRYLLIIEEINRANVAAVFGDMFQLLDRNSDGVSDYEIQTSEDVRQYLADTLGGNGSEEEYKTLKLPNNFYIWATMNSADQGVMPMDAAFKRRWNFEYLNIDNGAFKADIPIPLTSHEAKHVMVDWDKLRRAINDQLKTIPGINEDKLLGPFFIGNKDKLDKLAENCDSFFKLFKSKVLMYLFEDVVKMNPGELFNIKNGDNIHYSDICDDFDKEGLKVFVKKISDKFDDFKSGDSE